ncbi:AmmeMemoRadiSam system protein B [Nisaea sp.]|uniref:AmmeMemoRadiSam system protein B n=3 Tax=Nisaea sp. TaxID=2024842 RepID=UPI0032636AE7
MNKTGATRAPHVAGAFYPAEPDSLENIVAQCIAGAAETPVADAKIIIAPHAGYVFSGPIAGTAFKPLSRRRETIKRVVIVGPAHRVGFKGLATTSADAWATPLGTVPVAWDALRTLLTLPNFHVSDRVFEGEHSLEVHVPFLQQVLGDFEIVPILVGDASAGDVARALDAVWGGPETLISVSSDLSHFLDYETARTLDTRTMQSIELLKLEALDGKGACGHRAIAGALSLARRRDMRVTGLDTRNSGDTHGARDRVVGYGAAAMEYAGSARIPEADREQMIEAARFALRFGAEHGRPPDAQLGKDLSPCLTAMRASFVTVNIKGKLRGCIGSVIAHQPLLLDVMTNAYKAGFGDPRFPPLTAEELATADLHVSILSTPHALPFTSEKDLVSKARPDVDGLIMQEGNKRGLFLPSVWEGLPKAEDFIRNLKRKAGLPMDYWSDSLRVFRYTTESFGAPFADRAQTGEHAG